MSTKETVKSFWKKPEGKAGMIFLGGMVLLAYYKLLPFLLNFATNTFNLALTLLGIAAILYLFFDNSVRTFIFYTFKMSMRFLTGLIVRIDPIAVIESYIGHLKKKFQELQEKSNILQGSIQKLKDKINRNSSEAEHQLQLARQANNKGLSKEEISIFTRQAGRLQDMVKKFELLLQKMSFIQTVLEKAKKTSKILIDDFTNQSNTMKEEREAIRTGYNALSSALSILKGDPDKKAVFDQAVEMIQNEISIKSGIMDRFMSESDEIIRMVDLDNGIFEEKGMKMLEQWEKNSIPLLLGESVSSVASTTYTVNKEYAVVDGGSKSSKFKSIL